ncbi:MULTISPECIES: ABC transporter ATP-binding protein [unclassified Halomonas]|uniref:ABC transporter ATP-binding protein n=1 Tax=unclassified Halomonas TaxID=2609666 RepID=UPI001CF0FD78|nr:MULTISPECIES: ABC transporter ATP-binding protein [unclassified Halomonas]MCA8866862.1 ABC transporter ATP-binding protein [Halomonas sp. SBBP1]UZH08532.1 ABC transporter ATP-binding protein [Halomonas sp. BDJS001]
MSNLAARSDKGDKNKIHGHQVRDLMAALARAVLWPFRWRVITILLMQVAIQVMLLASLVLPWQLLQVLITGHSRIDGWVVEMGARSDKIAVLIVLAVLCFCAYALLKWRVKKAIATLSASILWHLNKTRLVANHRLLGKRVLGVVIGALSSTLIALLFCLLIALLHPLLALLAVVCVVGLGVVVGIYYRFERVQKIQDMLQGNVLTVINISFVLGFLIIVLDYLNGTMRPILTLFILLLGMRQLMAASVNGLVSFLSIIKYFQQINMLLLPRCQQVSLFSTTDFVQRFEQMALKQWLLPWLVEREHCGCDSNILQCRLLHGRTIAQVLVRDTESNGAPRYMLFKCYVPARENEALHETALLNEVNGYYHGAIPTVPVLLDSGRLPWCSFVLLALGDKLPQWKNSEERKPWMHELRQCLLHVPLPDALIGQYTATFASLPEWMKKIDAAHFAYLTQEDKESFQVERFMRLWPRMVAAVERIPKCLTVQNPSSARMATINSHMLLMDWQGWVYDTLGAYWPLSAKLHAEVLEVIGNQWEHPSSQQDWSEFNTPAMAANYVALAARAHEFCQRCHTNNDSGALNMVAGLLKAYEAISQED